jgi:ATP phosphoribosyltransferase
MLDLDFGGATFRWAAPAGKMTGTGEIGGRRIATAYPGVVKRYLDEHDVKADVVRLDGAVENAVRLGVADLIADVVETGATLRQAGLVTVGDPILVSSAILIGPELTGTEAGGTPSVSQLIRRLQGVLVARSYVMLAYDVRTDLMETATSLTPGIESPTVSPLHREGWVAVQAMVRRAEVHRTMDDLYEIGARAILVTDIANCRL